MCNSMLHGRIANCNVLLTLIKEAISSEWTRSHQERGRDFGVAQWRKIKILSVQEKASQLSRVARNLWTWPKNSVLKWLSPEQNYSDRIENPTAVKHMRSITECTFIGLKLIVKMLCAARDCYDSETDKLRLYVGRRCFLPRESSCSADPIRIELQLPVSPLKVCTPNPPTSAKAAFIFSRANLDSSLCLNCRSTLSIAFSVTWLKVFTLYMTMERL